MEPTKPLGSFSVQILENSIDHAYQLLIQGSGGDRVVLDLTLQQIKLLNARFSRAYLKRCKAERIYEAIDDASNCAQLEEIARSYSLCDACDFGNINLYGLNVCSRWWSTVSTAIPSCEAKCAISAPRKGIPKQ